MAELEFENILDSLQTPEGKLHFLKGAIGRGDKKAVTYAHKVVKEFSPVLAKRYANGDPVWEAGKMYEQMGLLEDALTKFLEVESFLKAAEISKRLGKAEEAQKYFSKYLTEELKWIKEVKEYKSSTIESVDELLKRLAREADNFGLREKANELLIGAVESVEDRNPSYALSLIEGRAGIDESIFKRLFAKIAKEEESEGNFKKAAEFSRKAGLEEQAKTYERILY